MILPPDEVEVDPIVLPILQRPTVCLKCQKTGQESKLESFCAFTEELSDGEWVEVHTYFCTKGHGWTKRTGPLSENKIESDDPFSSASSSLELQKTD